MSYSFSQELKRIGSFCVACLIIGLLTGQILLAFMGGALVYIVWTLRQIAKLDHWLTNRSKQDSGSPPDASGIWGDIFHKIDRLNRLHHREKHRLQTVIERVENTTSAINDAVILLSSRNIINWWNPAAERLLHFKPSDHGSFIGNYIRNPKFINYLEGFDFSLPLNLPAPQNLDRQFQYQITRFGANEGLLIVRDITHLHRLEQMRKDFVANVSHELRTPLTVVQGYLETLSDSKELTGPWSKAVDQMSQQTQRMNMLVNDLTELSRLETDQVENKQTAVNIEPLLQRIMNDALTISGDAKHQITLNIEQPWQLLGNERELYSALSNLLVNAVKYSPDGSTIEISAKQDSLKRLRISFKDQGIGIEPQHIHRLTERFYRVDASRSIDTGGTGLGLAIVKHVMLRHNGHLAIRSKLNQGSVFSCYFPEQQIIHQVHSHEPNLISE